MFKVTKAAGKEIKRSMSHHDIDDTPLRIAAQREPDGSIEYQMGFDDPGPADTMWATGGIDVIFEKVQLPLLNGTELDFVEMENGQHQFIFLNPNDEHYVAPNTSEATGATQSKQND